MRVMGLAVLGLLAWALPSFAHFVFLVADAPDAGKAKAVFSDSLEPDEAVEIEKIAGTKLWLRDAASKETPLMWTKDKAHYALELTGTGVRIAGGVTEYGIFQRGQGKPMRLQYWPKLIVGGLPTGDQARLGDRLDLELVPLVVGGKLQFQALYQGKPYAKGAFAILPPAEKGERVAASTGETDAEGKLPPTFDKPGRYGVRVLRSVMMAGEVAGKKYEELRQYATLTLHFAPGNAAAPVAPVDRLVVNYAEKAPDANNLLADAYAARAQWANFPGFRAEVEVNLNGTRSTGEVQVPAKGKSEYTGLNAEAQKWAAPTLGMAIGHRRGSDPAPACVFADTDTTHPLGRLVQLENDRFQSSYRIHDRQIMVVDRTMGAERFVITMLENIRNEEGKYLPAHYVVNYWNTESKQLTKTEAYTQTWQRVGGLDLPASVRIVTATPGTADVLTTKSVTLRKHQLLTAQ
jgi:hypothetical protein